MRDEMIWVTLLFAAFALTLMYCWALAWVK